MWLQGEEKFKKEKFVLSVAYSPDGRRLACGCMDGSVTVFDTGSRKPLHQLEGHYKPVRGLAFTPGALNDQQSKTGCPSLHPGAVHGCGIRHCLSLISCRAGGTSLRGAQQSTLPRRCSPPQVCRKHCLRQLP